MGLGMNDVVPIDTHVFYITSTYYLPELPPMISKSKSHWPMIHEFWKSQFGEYAGWAQSMLFTSELSMVKGTQGTKRKYRK
jgi:N-glycosylase/DNA lyase